MQITKREKFLYNLQQCLYHRLALRISQQEPILKIFKDKRKENQSPPFSVLFYASLSQNFLLQKFLSPKKIPPTIVNRREYI